MKKTNSILEASTGILGVMSCFVMVVNAIVVIGIFDYFISKGVFVNLNMFMEIVLVIMIFLYCFYPLIIAINISLIYQRLKK